MIQVFDGVLADPLAYRQAALAHEFTSVETGPGVVFHGISTSVPATVPDWLVARFPSLQPTLSFFRKSPKGQDEPNFIHTDRDMGDWTAILYLNPEPPKGDGTTFYQRTMTAARSSTSDTEDLLIVEWLDWRQRDLWQPWHRVDAAFNRLVVFTSSLFHARSIPENYGEGDNARLIQLVFGKGELQPCASAPLQP